MDLRSIVADFTRRLSQLIEQDAADRTRTAVLAAFGVSHRSADRPKKADSEVPTTTRKARRKGPPQLCPVPGCKNWS